MFFLFFLEKYDKIFHKRERVKKFFSLFLVFSLIAWLPVSDLFAMDSKAAKSCNSDADCTSKAASLSVCNSHKCYDHVCNTGYYLSMNCKGKQSCGRCDSEKEAVSGHCVSRRCHAQQKFTINIVDNPHITEPGNKGAWQGCICADVVPKYTVTYECGDGTGTAPVDENEYDENASVNVKENTCEKENMVFKNWKCGDQEISDTFTITADTKCVAQWTNCEECNPGTGCDCTLSVKNGVCTYNTSPKNGYVIVSGNGTATPQCKQSNEQQCTESGGVWVGGGCKCQPDVNGTHWDITNKICVCNDAGKEIQNGECVDSTKCPADTDGKYPDCTCKDTTKKYNTNTNTCDADALAEKQKAYDDAHAKEQSLANRSLTAATTAATGLGAMELARGLSEQKADKEAAADMAAYIETFRCEYGNGKSVKAGPESIELPGGNDQKIMNYRAEYFALANDLKERKNALGMKPGIESEEILDKSNMGLYDDESVGITGGNEASLYRAQMLKSEEDQTKIDEASAASQKRVKGGAIAAGAGVVGGVVGDSIINGKIGEKIKEIKDKRANTKENDKTITLLKQKLKNSGVINVDNLDLSRFDISALYSEIQNKDFSSLQGKDITSLLNTNNSGQFVNQLSGLLQ